MIESESENDDEEEQKDGVHFKDDGKGSSADDGGKRNSADDGGKGNSAANILKKPSQYYCDSTMNIGRKLNADEKNAISQHKNNLYLYVFVARCIAFCFRKENDGTDNQQNAALTVRHFDMMRANFHQYLRNGQDQVMGQHFFALNKNIYQRVLSSRHVKLAVEKQVMNFSDFREIFHLHAKDFIKKDDAQPKMEDWVVGFDLLCREKEMNLHEEAVQSFTHEGLYNLFQQILAIRKDEAKTISKACQLGNEDEQLAAFKRELESQMRKLSNLEHKDLPEFIRDDMPDIYIKKSIERIHLISDEKLNDALSGMQIKNKNSAGLRNITAFDATFDGIQNLKQVFNVDSSHKMFKKVFGRKKYTVSLTIHGAEGMDQLPNNAYAFLMMEIDGSNDMFRTDTTGAVASTIWDTEAKWIVAYPVTHFKLALVLVGKKRYLMSNETFVATCDIEIYAGLKIKNKWFQMKCKNRKVSFSVQIKISFSMDAPDAIKKSGFLYCENIQRWPKWKRRFFMIIQILGHKMILCTYLEKNCSPSRMLVVEGYTVDYCGESEKKDTGAKSMFFFKLFKDNDTLTFATDTEIEQLSWIRKLYMATGQATKPAGIDDWNTSSFYMEHAFRQGLSDMVEADPTLYDQEFFFSLLQEQTLRYRLKEPYTSQGYFSTNQKYVLDKYCSRYNISPVASDLDLLKHLTRFAIEDGVHISAELITNLYEHLALEISGQGEKNLPVTRKQYNDFLSIRSQLQPYVEKQLIHFRQRFPFGKPKHDMMQHIHLLQRIFVLGDYAKTDVEDFYNALDTCVQKAALVSYEEISPYFDIKDDNDGDAHVARLCSSVDECVDVVMEVKRFFLQLPKQFVPDYNKHILKLLILDIEEYLKEKGKAIGCETAWDSLEIFKRCQQHCLDIKSLKTSDFEKDLLVLFAPVVVRYCDTRENEISKGLEEIYKKHGYHHSSTKRCSLHNNAAMFLNQSFGEIRVFINSIGWPDVLFLTHINHRLKMFAADIYSRFLYRLSDDFELWLHEPSLNFGYLIPVECIRIMDTVCCISEKVEEMDLYENETDQHNNNDVKRIYHPNLRKTIEKTHGNTMVLVSQQFTQVLSKLLRKLSFLDYADILVKIASKLQRSEDFAKLYYNFSARNMEVIQEYMTAHQIYLRALEKEIWKNVCKTVHGWIEKRSKPTMHTYQFNVVKDVVESLKDLMFGLSQTELNDEIYGKIQLQLDVHRFWES